MYTFLIVAVFSLVLVLWLWAVLDITKSRRLKPRSRTLWFLLIILFPIVGPILYFQLKDRILLEKERSFNPDFGGSNH